MSWTRPTRRAPSVSGDTVSGERAAGLGARSLLGQRGHGEPDEHDPPAAAVAPEEQHGVAVLLTDPEPAAFPSDAWFAPEILSTAG